MCHACIGWKSDLISPQRKGGGTFANNGFFLTHPLFLTLLHGGKIYAEPDRNRLTRSAIWY